MREPPAGGSFKVRGAYLRIARLSAAERARGVVAASAGNHAQGVALAAAALGTRATVVMPAAAPLPKVAATRSYGADVVLHGANVEDALAMARDLAEQTGSIFIHPFDHPDVIAGQGTVGLEIAEQCPQVRTIVVPAGGGGLRPGSPWRPARSCRTCTLIGVQAEAVAPLPASVAAGHPVSVTPSATMADGIAVARPGDLTVALLAGAWHEHRHGHRGEPVPRPPALPGAGQAGGRASRAPPASRRCSSTRRCSRRRS